MNWEAWFTLAVVIVTVAILVRDLLPPSAAMFAATVAVLAVGIIDPAQAFAGFSNPAPITIGALYVLARAVEKTGVLTPVVTTMLGENRSPRAALLRLTAPTTLMSGFINNTPVVAMLIPQVENWGRTQNRSPSDYLMPLSFAAILGGVITLMGTATNIIVSGLFEEIGEAPMSFFEISIVGVPIALVCLAMIVLLAPILIPSRRTATEDLEDTAREYIVDMTVVTGGPLDGRSVEDAGLRQLSGGYLVELERGGAITGPVPPTTVLVGGDRLRFAGRSNQVVDLQAQRGLASAEGTAVVELDGNGSAYFEVVVGAASPLVGETARSASFRDTYQAAVLAIHRAGKRIDAKIGEVPFRVGDTLLLLADPSFRRRWNERRDFLLISRLGSPPPGQSPRALWVGAIAAGIVVAALVGMPLVTAAVTGAALIVLLGLLSASEARNAVNLDVVVTIAAAFGLAAAMVESGLADTFGGILIDVFGGSSATGLLLGVIVATVILKEVITNKAAVLLVFPIAAAAALDLGIDVRPLGMAVAVAGALPFLTPIGYQTNLMVYGPGGYRFWDYARLGLPLTIASIVLMMLIIPLAWPL